MSRPDIVDLVIGATIAEMRHEARMEEIRTMDVEAWVLGLARRGTPPQRAGGSR